MRDILARLGATRQRAAAPFHDAALTDWLIGTFPAVLTWRDGGQVRQLAFREEDLAAVLDVLRERGRVAAGGCPRK